MCLAVPMKVVSRQADALVKCRIGESDTFVTASTALLEEKPKLGEYLIVHAGFALRKIEPEDAEDTIRLLRKMAEAAETAGAE